MTMPALTTGSTELPSFSIPETTEIAKPERKPRGSRLADDVRKRAADSAPAASTTSAATPEAPTQPVKGGGGQQIAMPGGAAATVQVEAGVVTGVTATKPSDQSVIPQAPASVSLEEERKLRLAEEQKLIETMNLQIDDPVIVHLVGREPIETRVKSQAHIFGDMACVSVYAIEGRVALRSLSRPTK